MNIDRPEWMQWAVCAGMPTRERDRIFFPGQGQSTGPAKAICAGCPVRELCADHAVVNGEYYGIWGGLSEHERRSLRRERREAGLPVLGQRRSAPCGTAAGYGAHYRRGEDACPACRRAHTEAAQLRKIRRGAA